MPLVERMAEALAQMEKVGDWLELLQALTQAEALPEPPTEPLRELH